MLNSPSFEVEASRWKAIKYVMQEICVYICLYLSNITQLDLALLDSAATTPPGESQTIFILTFICQQKSCVKQSKQT